MGSPICVARLRITNAAGYFDSLSTVDTKGEQPRIRFDVTRTLRSEPNTAVIKIFNLAPLTAALILGVVLSREEWTPTKSAQLFQLGQGGTPIELISEQYGLGSVELSWGFMDSEAPNIEAALSVGFIGQSSKMTFRQEGNDQVLTIEASDGSHLLGAAEALQKAGSGVVPFVAKWYKYGTSYVDIIADLVTACGLTVDKAKLQTQLQAAMIARGLPPGDLQILHGYNAAGPARPQIEQVMNALGARWSVQNGELLILGASDVLTGFPPIELSTENGNIFGEPEVVDAFKMAVKTWAQPGAAPGRQVTLITPSRTANYRIEVAETSVDTDSGGETKLELDELQTIPGVF